MKKFLLNVILVCPFFTVLTQDPSFYQFSGIIRDDSYQPLEYVHVYNMSRQKGTVSGPDGRFSIVSLLTDTVLFSAMGYKTQYFSLPDTLSSKFFFQDVYLDEDTFRIKEVMIFPWKSYGEFKQAFFALDVTNKDKDNLNRNMELIRMQIMANDTYTDPGMAYKYVMDSYNTGLMNTGMPPINNLLNPIAWGRFIESIRSGSIRGNNRKNK